MPTRFFRHLFISAVALTSLGTLAYVALADDKPEQIGFYCVAPLFGTTRCGPADRNLQVGPGKQLSIQLDSAKNMDDKPRCVTFFVIHAVSGEQLASTKLCSFPNKYEGVWVNDKDGTIDVYTTVKSKGPEQVRASGTFIIERP